MRNITFDETLDKEKTKAETKAILKEIGELQYQMYAESKSSLLIVFQGLDASGKDGLTRGLLDYCNPVGLLVQSFKKPTPLENSHDFLWRVHPHVPPRGVIQVFIRSHYEDILVPTVEKLFPPEKIEERYEIINGFEKLLEQNGTRVLKFFLNVSKEAQLERLNERLVNPEKYWKHNDGDWDTREKFDEYQKVYDTIFERCRTIPWHFVPADANWQKLYFVSKVVLETLHSLNIKWPALKTEKFIK
ncbi:MAG TPA: PPK2 family polyphosphate kinase [Draconibacterium sp.]|jgi:PPK2 family polyphosphate:nucleotide phosphotransferase|nr:PPK2 family polyphosphate kinase [Draconibacterium sp.]